MIEETKVRYGDHIHKTQSILTRPRTLYHEQNKRNKQRKSHTHKKIAVIIHIPHLQTNQMSSDYVVRIPWGQTNKKQITRVIRSLCESSKRPLALALAQCSG